MNVTYNTVFGEEIVPTKYCKGCDQHLPITQFRRRGEGASKERTYTVCLDCEKKSHKIRKKLRKEAPKKPKNCECCGKETDELHLEHCHITDKFRGWVCEDCNTAIGRAGDNLYGVLNILKYMVERDLLQKNENNEHDDVLQMMKKNTGDIS